MFAFLLIRLMCPPLFSLLNTGPLIQLFSSTTVSVNCFITAMIFFYSPYVILNISVLVFFAFNSLPNIQYWFVCFISGHQWQIHGLPLWSLVCLISFFWNNCTHRLLCFSSVQIYSNINHPDSQTHLFWHSHIKMPAQFLNQRTHLWFFMCQRLKQQ